MNRSMMTIALLALGATSASAQGIPALGAAKAAANRAVNATNAHTHEETGQAITPRAVNGAAPAAATQPAATATTHAAQPSAPAKGGATKPDSGRKSTEAPATTVFNREVFSYDGAGRRDPFLSLLSTGELRPAFNDLKLVAVAYDPTGRKSVAVMRDVGTKDQYRVKVGQTLGRMRVAQIHPKSVTFTIDEFGYSRQDVLTLGDSTNMRNP
ncbi:MAG: hypothetical protein ACJ79K_11715 [Gemmatimonadaceae bacterium]